MRDVLRRYHEDIVPYSTAVKASRSQLCKSATRMGWEREVGHLERCPFCPVGPISSILLHCVCFRPQSSESPAEEQRHLFTRRIDASAVQSAPSR